MRVVGIDPGTGSFDFFGMDGERIILDLSLPVAEVAEKPELLIEKLRSVLPLDAVVGPSGYGLPVMPIRDMSERELDMMVPDDQSIPLYQGIRRVLWRMKEEGLPVLFTPGVIHLQTVPAYRKANRIDMGTADKVCCAALAIRDQAEHLGIGYRDTRFILAEVGYAFSAIMAVDGGKIVDGLGGTSGGPGFITLGGMDSELAVRLGKIPGVLLFSGGAKDASGQEDLTPEQLARHPDRYPASWNMLLESILKGVAAMNIAVENPREILLSGRLVNNPGIVHALSAGLSRFAAVRRVRGNAVIAKEAAEGAYLIGEGLRGGKYRELVDTMELKKARGTMLDYVLLKGIKTLNSRPGLGKTI
jgi:predicted butyrate kinase (DUF1464 family)